MAGNTDVAERKSADPTVKSQVETTAPVPNVSATPGTTKGDVKTNDIPTFQAGKDKNVLHNYRSWNYIFTISALDKNSIRDPKSFPSASKNYVIVKSSGKGSATISNTLSPSAAANNTTTNAQSEIKDLIQQFNKESPGRFDMFIDNVSINSLMTMSEGLSTSLANKLSFDIVEPYSMGGFLEALAVGARATGSLTYMSAVFLLKIEFLGYPDSVTGPVSSAETIPASTRYYPFIINGVEVEANEEKGTTYKVSAVPQNERGFGISNQIKTDIKMQGETVGAVLQDFFDNINKAIREDAKKAKGENTTNYDEYAIYWAPEPVNGVEIDIHNEKAQAVDIRTAKMNDELRGNASYHFPDPAKPAPGQSGYQGQSNTGDKTATAKYDPRAGAVSFAAGSQIHESIASVIRDSEYVKNLIQNLDKVKNDKNSDGLVRYFMISLQDEELEKNFDPQTLRRNKRYTYVVHPYKIHFSRIPGEQLGIVDFKPLQKMIRRTYDYLYTGKNVDVINFQLKFNHLYFQAAPARAGDKAVNDASAGAGASDKVDVTLQKTTAAEVGKNNGNIKAPIQTTGAQTLNPEGGSGQPAQGTPYHALAQNMHSAFLKSVDLNKVDLEIYGDPYYLTTESVGNQRHASAGPGINDKGEAQIYSGEVYVNINWRTPIDIQPLDRGGLMEFESKLLPFSGVYRVNSVSSTFSGAKFTQKLTCIRMPGQVIEATNADTKLPSLTNTPTPGQQMVKDTAPAGVQSIGVRPNDFSIANMLQRGLPSPGLPGVLSNFAGAAGGALGGFGIGSVTGALSAVAGAGGAVQNIVGQVKTLGPQLGFNVGDSLSGVNSLAQGLRLNASGAANILGGVANLSAAGLSSVGRLVDSALGAGSVNTISKLASGVTSQVSNISNLNANAVTSAVDPSKLASVKALGDSADNLVSNVGNNIKSVINSIPTSDPTAVASTLGIDPSQLAGLDPSIASKVTTQLQTVAQNVPENVDMTAVRKQGIIAQFITADNVKNLPPIQPAITAPLASQNYGDINNIIASGGNVSSIPGANNIPGIANANLLTNKLGQQAGGLDAISGGLDTTAITDKLASAQGQLNSTIAGASGLIGSINSLNPKGLNLAQANLGSVESNLSNIQGSVQGAVSSISGLGKSVTSQFGSLRAPSPLDNLIASNNTTKNDNLGTG